jgi:hypothetical protein
MNTHSIFYYPYASFTDAQAPLLKVAALYFDKIYLLDPTQASWATIGAGSVSKDVQLLQSAGILEIINPAEVLKDYEKEIHEAIRLDLQNPEFLDCCEARGGGRWTLALAKVLKDTQQDEKLRCLMGDFARQMAKTANDFSHHPSKYIWYTEGGQFFDEFRNAIEYRYVDVPLAIGEAIMLNHVLFSGLKYANATPLTDDPFHSELLNLKIQHTQQIPTVHQALEAKARKRQLKADLLAINTLMEKRLNLPVLSPQFSLEKILEYRAKHHDQLQQAREKLSRLARRLQEEPWSEDFNGEVNDMIATDIANDLKECQKARDSWLKSIAIPSTVIGLGTASTVLGLVATPLTPIAITTAAISLTTGSLIPAAQWFLNWQQDKQSPSFENGLHYLLKINS